jgi:hypothetical protein
MLFQSLHTRQKYTLIAFRKKIHSRIMDRPQIEVKRYRKNEEDFFVIGNLSSEQVKKYNVGRIIYQEEEVEEKERVR